MAFSAAPQPSFLTTSSHHHSTFCFLSAGCKLKVASLPKTGRPGSAGFIRSGLDSRKPRINGNEATEPARILLEKNFAPPQRLEGQLNKDSQIPRDGELVLNFEISESDLQAVLTALKKKEEDLQNAERMVVSEHNVLNNTKEELVLREQEIIAAYSRQEKLGDELRHANVKLASQAREIEDLRLRVQDRDQEIIAMRSSLSLKEVEIEKMRNELVTKSEKAAKTDSELSSMAQLLNEASEVVRKQAAELEDFRSAIQVKDEELTASSMLHKFEEEKWKVAEGKLAKQTMEWLLTREELMKLAESTSFHMAESREALKEFKKVKTILLEVRDELVSSQKSLCSSRMKMEDQAVQLERQLAELEQKKASITSYGTSLKNAEMEVESERVKLQVAELRNKELEQNLSAQTELLEKLQLQSNEDRSSLLKAAGEMKSLQQELKQKNIQFEETHNLLQIKGSELVDAKVEIQHLKTERDSLRLGLAQKNAELINAKKKLEVANQEVEELKVQLSSRESQLNQATTLLQEKEEHVEMVQHELSDAKLKSSEAEMVVERIMELTQELAVTSKQHKDHDERLPMTSDSDFKWQNRQLEIKLRHTREILEAKEAEIVDAQRALMAKDEEHKAMVRRLEAKEREVEVMKEQAMGQAGDLETLFALAQERIGEKSIGDLAVEKLQLEAAYLEVEVATGTLQKLVEMSRSLVNACGSRAEGDTETISEQEVEVEVARLSTLTEQLLREAGMAAGAVR